MNNEVIKFTPEQVEQRCKELQEMSKDPLTGFILRGMLRVAQSTGFTKGLLVGAGAALAGYILAQMV